MFKSINVEAENLELILENSHGDKVIIPANKRNWVKQKLSEGCHDCIDSLVETLPIASQYAQDGSVYPPNAKVKVNINNQIKEYDISSPEYKNLYDSGKLMSYDKNTDTYIATPLKEVTITAEAPQWLKDKRKYESQYSRDWYIDNIMPKFSRGMGISANNMHPNNIKEYDSYINDKVVEDIFKRKPTFDNDYSNDRLKTLQGFSQKELELIKNSKYASKIEPSIWSKFEQGLLSVGNAGSPVTFKNENLTQKEAKKEDNPLNILQPLNIPSKIVQSTYKDDYTFKDALKGKQNSANIEEDLITDPLNLVGLGIWSKLSKANKFAKLEDAYQAVKGLSKEEAISKLINKFEDVNVLNPINGHLPGTEEWNKLNNEIINLRRNSRTNNLPPAPFVTNSEFPQPIDNLMDALNLSDSEFTRLRNTYKNDPNYFKNNRIFASESALNNFITAENPRMFENNFLNINNNTSISDLINNRALTERLDFDLNKYKNLTFNELVIKNPTLAEKLKLSLSKLKENTIKFTKDLDLHAGTIINPKQSVDRIKLESSINDLLNQGLGIKKTDIPIQVKSEGNKLKIYIDQEKNGKFLESGYINIPEEGLNQKTLTETLLSTFKKEHKGVQKTLDFPTNNIGSSSLFNSNINTTGIGGELGEAIKQGLKQQNKSWNLLSSTSHTNEGALRYLTEYLNNRKLAIDISGNPEWLKIAEETKKLYPNGIKKAEVEKLLKNNPDLRPSNIKFAYSLIPIILGTNYIQSQNQNKSEQ